jgi:hypothetical protein
VKKLKKHVILFTTILMLVLPIIAINAAPIWETFGLYPWVNFKVTNSGLHIASDPLFESAIVNDIPPYDASAVDLLMGWVTFPCATDKPGQENAPKGFEFSITAFGIPAGRYDVMAYPTIEFPPPPDDPFPSDDFGSGPYLLGTLRVRRNGVGELNGFYDMPAGIYAWRITVESSGGPVLETHWIDPVGFLVIS